MVIIPDQPAISLSVQEDGIMVIQTENGEERGIFIAFANVTSFIEALTKAYISADTGG